MDYCTEDVYNNLLGYTEMLFTVKKITIDVANGVGQFTVQVRVFVGPCVLYLLDRSPATNGRDYDCVSYKDCNITHWHKLI